VITTFLRPPHSVGQIVADGIRVLGVLSLVAAFVWCGPVEVAVFALALLGLVVPRFLGIRAAFDIGFGLIVLIAAWSNVFDLYTRVPGWDIVIHFIANGLTAAVLYVLFIRLLSRDAGGGTTEFPSWAAIVLTTAFGLAAGVVWEFGEWVGHTYIDSAIFVNYDDTIGDLAAGALGAIVAGTVLRYLMAHNTSVDERSPGASLSTRPRKAQPQQS
jgi:hypothetical protein